LDSNAINRCPALKQLHKVPEEHSIKSSLS